MTTQDQLGLFISEGLNENKFSKRRRKISISIEVSEGVYDTDVDSVVKDLSNKISDIDATALMDTKKEDLFSNWTERPFFALDVETTGLDAASNRIIELALVPFNMSSNVKAFNQLFSVDEPLPPEIIRITGISDDMLENQPKFSSCLDQCVDFFSKAAFIVAYNAKFDRPFMESEFARFNKVLPELPWVDPFIFVCDIDRYKRGKKLSDAAKRWGVNLENAHRAQADAQAAGQLMLKMSEQVDCQTLDELLEKQKLLQWQNAHSMAELKKASSWSINR